LKVDREIAEEIRGRTRRLAVEVFKFLQTLGEGHQVFIIKNQPLRSITSVAANYRAGCRTRSTREFYSKLCIVIEEADESLFWLEFLVDTRICDEKDVQSFHEECFLLLKLLSKSRKTLSLKLKNKS
jgi:four helix bundle protein